MFDLKAFETELIATMFAMSYSLSFNNKVCIQGIEVNICLRQDMQTDRYWIVTYIQKPGSKNIKDLHWISTNSFYLGDPAAKVVIQKSVTEQLKLLAMVGVFDQWYTDTLGTL